MALFTLRDGGGELSLGIDTPTVGGDLRELTKLEYAASTNDLLLATAIQPSNAPWSSAFVTLCPVVIDMS
jgi:hypothetical protein